VDTGNTVAQQIHYGLYDSSTSATLFRLLLREKRQAAGVEPEPAERSKREVVFPVVHHDDTGAQRVVVLPQVQQAP